MTNFSFNLSFRDVPYVKSNHRNIQTQIPVPESIPLLENIKKFESTNATEQLPVIWDHAKDYQIFDSWGITSGLQQALVDKNVIAGLRFTKKIINVNTLQDLICANSYVLKNITKQKNFIDKNSKIDVNAKIGPNVSIGKNSVINAQTSISNSIIMNDVIVKRGASIKNSVIYNGNIVTQNSNIINQIII